MKESHAKLEKNQAEMKESQAKMKDTLSTVVAKDVRNTAKEVIEWATEWQPQLDRQGKHYPGRNTIAMLETWTSHDLTKLWQDFCAFLSVS